MILGRTVRRHASQSGPVVRRYVLAQPLLVVVRVLVEAVVGLRCPVTDMSGRAGFRPAGPGRADRAPSWAVAGRLPLGHRASSLRSKTA
jgi:hypothetical protein